MTVSGKLSVESEHGAPAPNVSIDTFELQGGEIRTIDVAALLRSQQIPPTVNYATVIIYHSGPPGALVGRSFSVSADKKYGFYSALEQYTYSGVSEVYWTTEEDRDSILTVANFRDAQDAVRIEVTYNGGVFALPDLVLAPRASQTISMRDVLATGVDRDGRSFPEGITSGGFRIRGDAAKSRFLVKEHVIDHRHRFAMPFYGTPIWATSMYITASGAYEGGMSYDFDVIVTFSDSSQELDCGSVSSSNSSVANVSKNSWDCRNTLEAGNVGSATISAWNWHILDAQGTYGILATQPTQVQVRCSVPTGFRQTNVVDLSGGVLRFFYAWDSSNGNNNQLFGCEVGEYVAYPGSTNPYQALSPPFPADALFPNPTVIFGSATNGVLVDTHSIGSGTFVQPFIADSFTGQQTYRWRCKCFSNNDVQHFQNFEQLPIVRSVSQISGVWTYKITKSGSEATKTLP